MHLIFWDGFCNSSRSSNVDFCPFSVLQYKTDWGQFYISFVKKRQTTGWKSFALHRKDWLAVAEWLDLVLRVSLCSRLITILPRMTKIYATYRTFMWPCIVTNFFVIKPNRCTNFTNLFCHETLHVSDRSSVHHQEFIHCTLSNGICHTGL